MLPLPFTLVQKANGAKGGVKGGKEVFCYMLQGPTGVLLLEMPGGVINPLILVQKSNGASEGVTGSY